MKIFNFEFHISNRTRRDWEHVKESAAEFIAEMRRPVELISFAVAITVTAFFMLLPWIAE